MRPAFLVAIVLCAAGACDHTTSQTTRPRIGSAGPGPNVLLMSIDDLRRDRLGLYGEERPTSPRLDRLATESVVFENAYATSSWTLPSHVSMFSGLHPKSHRAIVGFSKPDPDIPMLTEILHAAGYRTFALTGGGWVTPGFGFGRGFEEYETAWAPRRAVRKTLQKLEALGTEQPYFYFFHTFGVHCPFNVPGRYEATFDRRPPEDHLDLRGKCGEFHFDKMDLTDGQIAFVSDRYDAGIRRTDDELAPLWDFLRTRGDLDRTIVVVTSDHGEEFAEHGHMGHGRALYSESLRVPLLIRVPGLAPRRVTTPVSLVDLAPTLLDLLGLPSDGMEGRSLVPLLVDGDGAAEDRPVYAETNHLEENVRTVVFDGHQLIVDATAGQTEMFDLARDPQQLRPLEAAATAPRTELARLLEEHFADAPPLPVATQGASKEIVDQLRALGYVE